VHSTGSTGSTCCPASRSRGIDAGESVEIVQRHIVEARDLAKRFPFRVDALPLVGA
jgi:hypothetical protein